MVYGGENPYVATLSCFPPSIVSSNSFNVLFWVLGAVIVVGVAGLSVPCPRAHSTHDCIHYPLPCLLGFCFSSSCRKSVELSTACYLHGLFIPHRGLFIRAFRPLSVRLTQRDVRFICAHAGILVLCSSCTSHGSSLVVHAASR